MKNKLRLLAFIFVCTAILSIIPLCGYAEENSSSEKSTADKFEYILLDDGTVAVSKYNGSDANVSLPFEIDGYVVSEVYSSAFSGNETLESIIISSGVKYLGENCFKDCTALKRAEVSEGLLGIGESCFENCKMLNSFYIPNTVTGLGEKAFLGCDSLKSLELPNTLMKIGEYCYGYKAGSSTDEYTKYDDVTVITPESSIGYRYAYKNNLNVEICEIRKISSNMMATYSKSEGFVVGNNKVPYGVYVVLGVLIVAVFAVLGIVLSKKDKGNK